MHFWWGITALGSAIGAVFLVIGIMSDSAPKQAAGAAMGAASAVIPYCLARAIEGYQRAEEKLKAKKAAEKPPKSEGP